MTHTTTQPTAAATSSVPPDVVSSLYGRILQFYGAQMRSIDARRISEYAETFAPDGVMRHPDGAEDVGRNQIVDRLTSRAPHFAGLAVCHWFDKMTIDSVSNNQVATSYYAMVSRTGSDGVTHLTPPFLVSDQLLVTDSGILTQQRYISTISTADGTQSDA